MYAFAVVKLVIIEGYSMSPLVAKDESVLLCFVLSSQENILASHLNQR